MISRMREYFKGLKFVLLIIIVAFIATSVVYFGTGSVSGPDGPTRGVASVNGEAIPVERYRRAYTNYMEFYRQTYRDRLTPEVAERLGIPQQVLDAVINDALVVQQAEREGVGVSDEELRQRIQSIRAFQEDGRFSRERYLAVLRQIRTEPGVFEAEQRREIQRRKMEGLIWEGVKVSDGEVMQAYALRREKVRAAWAHLATQALAGQITVSDADAEAYLKTHQAQFTRPERRRIDYAVLSARAFADPVSDADAEAYYKEHGAEFDKPRRLRTSHVLVRVPPVGGSEAEQKSRARIEEVIRRARVGEDFATLAKEVSEDPATAQQGGDLGFVGRGEMLPEFEQAVFALKKGEVSPTPVRTPFGYHAIRVTDVQEGGRQPFKEVGSKIKEKLLTERSEQAARKRAEELKAPLQAAGDFAAEAKKAGLAVHQATVGRGDSLEGIGRDPQLEEAIFTIAVGGVSTPVKTAGGYAIVRVGEAVPAGVPQLAEIKGQVSEAKRREEAEKLAMSRATALAEALAKGGDFPVLAKREGFATGELPLFSRADPPKDRSALPGAVLLAALQTPTGQVSKPVSTTAGVYLVKSLERQPPDPKGLESEREELRGQLLEQKRGQALERWVKGLRAAAKVEVTGRIPGAGRDR